MSKESKYNSIKEMPFNEVLFKIKVWIRYSRFMLRNSHPITKDRDQFILRKHKGG